MRAASVLGILVVAVCAELPLLFVSSYSGGAGERPLSLFAVLVGWSLLPIGFAAAMPTVAYLRKRSIRFEHTPYTIIAIAGVAGALGALPGDHSSGIALFLGFLVQCVAATWALIAGCNLTRQFKADAR